MPYSSQASSKSSPNFLQSTLGAGGVGACNLLFLALLSSSHFPSKYALLAAKRAVFALVALASLVVWAFVRSAEIFSHSVGPAGLGVGAWSLLVEAAWLKRQCFFLNSLWSFLRLLLSALHKLSVLVLVLLLGA